MIPNRVIGEKATCPVCNKSFKISEDSCYIVGNAYCCSWKCFLDRVKANEAEGKPKKYDKKKAKKK